jgi:hypothetical protein
MPSGRIPSPDSLTARIRADWAAHLAAAEPIRVADAARLLGVAPNIYRTALWQAQMPTVHPAAAKTAAPGMDDAVALATKGTMSVRAAARAAGVAVQTLRDELACRGLVGGKHSRRKL